VIDDRLTALLDDVRQSNGSVLVLTGAGISAESGIPTFRGHDGYWVVGSRNYTPQEMATLAMFHRRPEEVWKWYLHRFTVCRKAEPNAGHRAIVRLEEALQDRFRLVTQNIDGLHRRAGSSAARTYCIHGDSAWIRCSAECSRSLSPMPFLPDLAHQDQLGDEHHRHLTCPHCGAWMRPHVLWFDECYDEEYYRLESTLQAAMTASLLLVVGTSGATNLPMHVGSVVLESGGAIVDINPQDNPFSEMAGRSKRGCRVRGTAVKCLPEIVDYIVSV